MHKNLKLPAAIPYFLKILPHLEIPPPSKSRRTYKEVGSNKRHPRNLAAWKRVIGFKVYAECRRTRAIHTIEMVECAGARQVSVLVVALEILPLSKFRHRVQRLEIKSRRGEISRKYGIYWPYNTSTCMSVRSINPDRKYPYSEDLQCCLIRQRVALGYNVKAVTSNLGVHPSTVSRQIFTVYMYIHSAPLRRISIFCVCVNLKHGVCLQDSPNFL